MAIAANILNPFIQIVLPDVGRVFVLFGGIVAVIGALAWIAAFIIRRKYTKITPFAPKAQEPTTPVAPTPPAAAPRPPQSPVAAAPQALPQPTAQQQGGRTLQVPQNRPKPPVPPRIIQ
jgi:hypothetical protein